MSEATTMKLKPAVRFREFPFGTNGDPTMRDFTANRPREFQDKVLQYLRSGKIIALPMGASLTDWFDQISKANVVINGKPIGGTTVMTDGVWFWYAGLIYFIEKYNVQVSEEFLQYAAEHNWKVEAKLTDEDHYDFSYFP